MSAVTVRPRHENWHRVPPPTIASLAGEKANAITSWLKPWTIENRKLSQREVLEGEWIALRLEVSAIQLREAVVIDPQIRGGVPVLAGTRISIAQILVEIADGEDIYAIAEEYAIDSGNIKKLFEGIATQFDRSFRK